ncbi:MAG: NAD(P)H-hydrate dehydratase [Proteobacteria bacterium]|nr:NAD(P)H-hydrate dehydratase [Desulfobacteraceae bacterium]MBU2521952.1 NAD(P)H-hydrate dehydratase [Pseudomonadota bacterium]MBU3980219.1 NAD(P)H-hydrate dehydratase [Pseudomonadota bacterium]MBU4013170.1 NAD(P)H-hydrate dehydratase [Pseudomonadota bacterium]MBU4067981.1 NAD(P)H-hydrate dehydratase [Pseudomonadota bacterium]
MYLVTAGEMQEMDRQTIESYGLPGRVLMENAGLGATQILLKQFKGLVDKKVGIVAGRGNNGGDGFVMARYLSQKGISVTVYLLAKKSMVKGDAAENLNLLAPLDITVIEMPDQKSFSKNKTSMLHQDIWIDAILGTGLKSDVKGYFRKIIEFINSLARPVFSVDIPSGLNADTGQPCGACIQAHTTATFAFAKTGHLIFPGAGYTGNLEIIDIGIPNYIAEKVGPKQFLLTSALVRSTLQKRSPEAHKGNTGHLLIIAGSTGKTGAAAMTALSAMRSGAGLVTLGIPKSLNPVLESQVLEVMTSPLPEAEGGILDESSFDEIMDLIAGKKCLAVGPGLGTASGTKNLVIRIIQECRMPIVIDADGLNNLIDNIHILKNLKNPVILTPHPGEMSRLIGKPVSFIQNDRINCARNFAKKFKVHVVLKGARTVIAHPDGKVFINPTGNPGMASGGMGDALTGIIAGFVTQGYSPESATHIGVYLHGAAADTLQKNMSPFGFLATELINAIPGQIQHLINATQVSHPHYATKALKSRC